MTQDKNSATISKYDKFLQDLADINSARHNKSADTFALAKSSAISLHNSHSSVENPLIEGLGILQKMLGKDISGDPKGTKWGYRSGPNIVKAIDAIKEVFPRHRRNTGINAICTDCLYSHVSKQNSIR